MDTFVYTKMVIWTPIPDVPKLRCNVCQIEKERFDKNDDIVISKDGNHFVGTWLCPHGHANKV
jgi:hypothetical protein